MLAVRTYDLLMIICILDQNNVMLRISLCLIIVSLMACSTSIPAQQATNVASLHIVFVTGDEEYRSEESMPMLGKILKRELGAKISIAYSMTDGIVDPNRVDNIEGLEALQTADMMIVFTRFRALPDDQLQYITDFANTGKPMVGFRTATHAFMYEDDRSMSHMNDEWPTRIFGQQWITHHGHFADGNDPLTRVSLREDKANHSVLRGVEPFDAYSWLYHVQGGDWSVYGDKEFLLEGLSLRSKHQENNRLDQYPMTNPVAWTKTFNGGRVFFTTLGHPYDFIDVNMRKLALNGIYWALGKEAMIPADGVNADFVDEYKPNNSGFGQKFKPNLKPEKI